MYICNCNGITERQVKVAIQAGAIRWQDVHTHFGCMPQCGKCECEIVNTIAKNKAYNNERHISLFPATTLTSTN